MKEFFEFIGLMLFLSVMALGLGVLAALAKVVMGV